MKSVSFAKGNAISITKLREAFYLRTVISQKHVTYLPGATALLLSYMKLRTYIVGTFGGLRIFPFGCNLIAKSMRSLFSNFFAVKKVFR